MKLLTAFLLVLSTSLVAQTTLDEYNYANGGYLQLEKLGADSKSGYEIIKDETHRFYSGKWISTYQIFKLIRTEDESLAAVIFYNKTVKEVYCTAVDPNSELDIQQRSLSDQRIFSGWVASQPSLFIDMVQQAYWKSTLDDITDNIIRQESTGYEEH